MIFFKKSKTLCSLCGKRIGFRQKNTPKKEWNVRGPLCSDCHVEQIQKNYDEDATQECVSCGLIKKLPDMWEPRWQWEMKGLLCKPCFDEKEERYQVLLNYCRTCGKKLGFFRYNPKKHWNITKGQLCRNCWDKKKKDMGQEKRMHVSQYLATYHSLNY